MNASEREHCDECGLSFVLEKVAPNTVYTFWAVAYNVQKGYESGPSEKVMIDTSSYGEWILLMLVPAISWRNNHAFMHHA